MWFQNLYLWCGSSSVSESPTVKKDFFGGSYKKKKFREIVFFFKKKGFCFKTTNCVVFKFRFSLSIFISFWMFLMLFVRNSWKSCSLADFSMLFTILRSYKKFLTKKFCFLILTIPKLCTSQIRYKRYMFNKLT